MVTETQATERVQFAWGSWKLFELFASRLSPNCECLWDKL